MKIIKPLDLGLMYRVYEQNRCHYLVSTAIAYFSFATPESLETELELWPMVAEELGSDGVIDTGMPKVGSEFLVSGKIFPENSSDPHAGTVTVTVAGRQKKLNVFGNRQWQKNSLGRWQLSEPDKLTELPIQYEYAFGGQDYPENPLGKGYVKDLGQYPDSTIDVPNIMLAGQPMAAPDQQMVPAGFSPYDFTWPQRYTKIGTYDEKWLRDFFPGLANDFDPTFLNIAPSDQQFPEKFIGDESFSCENMHPHQQLISSKLPGIRVRCFVNSGNEEAVELLEIGMQADTLWLFPHRERAVLLFRGITQVRDDDASEYQQMLLAYENLSHAPRELAHYTKAMELRLDKKKGHLQAFNEKDLIADGAVSAMSTLLTDSMASMEESTLAKNLKKKSESEVEAAWKRLEELGLDPEKYQKEENNDYIDITTDNLDQLDDLLKKVTEDTKKHQQEMETMAREVAESMGQDYDQMLAAAKQQQTGPARFSADTIIAQLQEYKLSDPKKEAKLRKMEEEFANITLQYGHFFDQPALVSAELREKMRQDILQARDEGKSVAGGEYPGVDLSNLDLRGMDFSACFMDGANLTGSDLRETDFSKAMLARADLSGARFENSTLNKTNLGKSNLNGAVFLQCKMEKAVLYQASLQGTSFDNVQMTGVDASECKGQGVRFFQSELQDSRFMESMLDESDFSQCNLSKAFFHKTSARKAKFIGATLNETVLVEFTGDGADFSTADMENIRTAMGTSFQGADFTKSNLKDANLREVDCRESNFTASNLSGADLSKSQLTHSTFYRSNAKQAMFRQADLRESRMVSINLMEGSLQKANLEKCDLRGANLFAADLMQVDFSTVLLEQANTKKTILSSRVS